MLKQLSLITHDINRIIPADDILARQRYFLFRILSLFGALLLLTMVVEELLSPENNRALALSYLTVACTLIFNYVGLQIHKNFKTAYVVSIIALLSLIHCVTYFYGGIRNPDFFYMGSIILYSYIVLENKGGRITLWLSVINVIYFYALTDFTEPGAFISNHLSERSIDAKHLYTVIISMVIMTSLSSYLSYSKNAVITKIEESKAILEVKNAELLELSLVASETINSVVITDKTGEIEWVNDGFTRLTGYEASEVIRRKMSDFMYGDLSDPKTISALENKTFTSNNLSAEIIKYKKNGELIWVQENVTRIFDDVENKEKYIFIESDITQRKKSEHRMSEYLNNLEKTNKELDKFAYIVSHDLKAPLRAIGNLTGWIEEDSGHMLSQDVRKNFNLIKERVVRMEALINGILDYSKVAKKNNQFEEFEVCDVVNDSIEMLGRPYDCRFLIDGNLPKLVADKLKIEQVFINIIGNAIKFNANPEKVVRIRSKEFENHYQFSISDNGPGIDPRFHDKVFLIFQTINTRDEFESTGVGLAIVKKIIEEQNSKIWIESTPGNGATFHFNWPKQPEPTERSKIYLAEQV